MHELYSQKGIYSLQDGLFLKMVEQTYTKEELEKMAGQEIPGPEGVHFMIHEIWDSAEQRMRYSRADEHKFTLRLVPHILPEHSHEFYETI